MTDELFRSIPAHVSLSPPALAWSFRLRCAHKTVITGAKYFDLWVCKQRLQELFSLRAFYGWIFLPMKDTIFIIRPKERPYDFELSLYLNLEHSILRLCMHIGLLNRLNLNLRFFL